MLIGDVQIYDEAVSLFQKLTEEFAYNKWDRIILCSAFLTERAANDIIAMIDRSTFCKDTQITFLIGTKQYFTKPDAIRMIIKYKETNSKSNLRLTVLRPDEMEFHLKCYMFHCTKSKKALVGSANLTSVGLDSRGELMIEVNELKIVEGISSYIDCFLKRSVMWEECIDEYIELYEKYRPTFEETNHFQKSSPNSNHRSIHKLPIKSHMKDMLNAAPTIDSLRHISDDIVADRMRSLCELLRRQGKEINIGDYIILDGDKNENLKKYQEAYSFDRAFGNGYDGWGIGEERAIYIIGAVGVTEYDEVVIYMKPYSIYKYKVTKEIIDKAEEYGIKSDTPTQENLERYKRFIKSQTK